MGKARGGRRERLAVDARREQLLELGLSLFGKKSYDEISIDEIAQRAGISKGLLYHYFPSKRDFYVAALSVAADELCAATELPPTGDPLADLRAALEAYLDYVERHAPAYVTLFRGGIGNDPDVRAIVDATRERLLERLLSRIETAKNPLIENAFRGYVGFVEAAVLDWIDRREVAREEVVTLCLKLAEATARAVVT